MLTNTCRLLSVACCLLSVIFAGCHQNAPRTSHSVVDIQGRKCEEMRTLVDNGRNRDFAYSYNCEGGGPPLGYMAATPYMQPFPLVTRAQAALLNAPYNPPDEVCQDVTYKEDGQPKFTVPSWCVQANTIRNTQTQPLVQPTSRKSARVRSSR